MAERKYGRLIMVTGHAGSGKDTCVDYLINSLSRQGVVVHRRAFADQVKVVSQMLINGFYGVDIPLSAFAKPDEKERLRPEWPLFNGQTASIRRILQYVGTDIGRNQIDPDVWVRPVVNFYQQMNPQHVLIVSDLRFPGEYQAFRHLPGEIMCLRVNRHSVSKSAEHVSESLFDRIPVTHQIDNNGSYDQLYAQLDGLLSQYS
jgi:hypothetical protein